jgi:hypothetical protein
MVPVGPETDVFALAVRPLSLVGAKSGPDAQRDPVLGDFQSAMQPVSIRVAKAIVRMRLMSATPDRQDRLAQRE